MAKQQVAAKNFYNVQTDSSKSMSALSKRQELEIQRAELENEKSTFYSLWRDCGDFILPRRTRFQITDVNRGDRRNLKIIDSTATLAARTTRSGMMSGVTSPARPWFRLTTPDQDLSDYGPVKDWLHVVTSRMTSIYLRSNLYNVLPTLYGDLAVFGTSAMSVEDNFDDVLRCRSFPIGSYSLALDMNGKVNVFRRDYRMNIRQLVEMFGKRNAKTGAVDWSNFSTYVKNAWDRSNYESWIDVAHCIRPNKEHDDQKIDAKYKRYESCYYERGYTGLSGQAATPSLDPEVYLRESGYDYFPILAPRWEVAGEDTYGTSCPGIDALGDIKQLQLGEKRAAQAIEKMINPPMVAPTALRSVKTTILPGDITYSDEREGTKGFRPAHEINFRLEALENKQQQIRGRIQRCFYEDLFLMLAESDRRQITAREVEERHEEKLLALGPVLEQLNQDLLNPLIDITFDLMNKAGLIPEAPEELHGMPLRVDYVSIMAQAQKLAGIGGMERFMSNLSTIVQVTQDPQGTLAKVDIHHYIDELGNALGLPPKIVRSEDETQAIQQQQQQQAAAQQKMAAIEQGAGAAKDLSQADMGGNNALTQLLQQSQAGQMVAQ